MSEREEIRKRQSDWYKINKKRILKMQKDNRTTHRKMSRAQKLEISGLICSVTSIYGKIFFRKSINKAYCSKLRYVFFWKNI